MKQIFITIGLVSATLLCDAQQKKMPSFLSTENIDKSVKPNDNFYLHVNGAWIKNTPIPPSESRIGAFLDVYNKSKDNLKKIFDELKKSKAAAGTNERKVADFFESGMDEAAIEKLGFDPIKPFLNRIDKIKTSTDFLKEVALMQTEQSHPLFAMYVGADEKNSAMNIPTFYQGGLGLPDRDYYFKTDPNTVKVVKAYKAFLKSLFVLTGTAETTATGYVDAIYNFEKSIAEQHSNNVELRDPQTNYNKMAVANLQSQMPNIDWQSWLTIMRIKTDSVNVGQPKHFKNLNDLIAKTPIETLKVYLKATTISDAANALSKDFVNARFEYTKSQTGAKELKPRWERMITVTDACLSDALGQMYVKKYFTEDSKKRMLSLINNLQKAFDNRMNKLDWMSDETKLKAKQKLYTFLKKIGFPDKWRDYSKVKIGKDNYFNNLLACGKNDYDFMVSKVGKKVDKTEWGMTPSTVNAYYNPTFNEIVFPAGILQFPFFDPKADDAINYGGIGMVIGHEMTHGFDDQGAQYDKEGNMINWWSSEDETKFKAKGEAVVKLYDGLTVLDTVHVKGALTLGENIADIGGIAIAYEAFKMTAQGKANVMIDGYTPDQRFFMSYGQIWKSKAKDEATLQRINTDPHSPPIHRVNAPLMNFEPFYKAFDVKPGDAMYVEPKDRIKIW